MLSQAKNQSGSRKNATQKRMVVELRWMLTQLCYIAWKRWDCKIGIEAWYIVLASIEWESRNYVYVIKDLGSYE